MAWGNKSFLRLGKIASSVILVLLEDGERRVSARFHIFVSYFYLRNEDAGWVQYFCSVFPEMEGLSLESLELLQAGKNREYALEVGCGGLWSS